VTAGPPGGRLGARIAAVLRIGTLVAVAAVATGFVIALFGRAEGLGARPVLDLVGAGGADALITLGLVGLTLLPFGVLAVAALTFGTHGERRYLLSSLATLGLLVASLVAAALLTAPS
jgi:hypothetical protein